MNSNKLLHAIGLINTDTVTEVERYLENKGHSSEISVPATSTLDPQIGRRRFMSMQFAGLAAAMLILVVGTVVMLRVFAPESPSTLEYDTEVDDTRDSPDIPAPDLGTIRGLPTRNFRLSENADLPARSFVEWFHDSRVVIARVESVEMLPFDSDSQRSTLRILQNVRGDAPETLTITQLSGTPHHPETEHFLREGGVYVLPWVGLLECLVCPCSCGCDCPCESFVYFSAAQPCAAVMPPQIVGDHFAVFEIDDSGLIFSHSRLANFNAFDGKPYTYLISEIERLNANSEFNKARSTHFERALNWWWSSALIEFTVTGDGEYVWDTHIYNATVHRIISNIGEFEIPDTFRFFVNSGDRLTENGGRYLAFFDTWEPCGSPLPPWQLFIHSAAIDENRRIRESAEEWYVFARYEGYTVEEIAQLIERLAAFRATFDRERVTNFPPAPPTD
jgi:hypothetical protein